VNRALRAGVLTLGLTGLLLVVALAARSGHPANDGSVSTRAVPASLQDSLVTLLVIFYVFAAAIVVVMLFRRRTWQAPEESRWLRTLVKIVVFMLLVSVLGFLLIRHTDFHRDEQKPQGAQGAPSADNHAGKLPPGATRSAEFQWPLALGVLGLIVLAGVILVVRDRRSAPDEPLELTVGQALARSIETSIDDLRNEPDARRAVIAAYAGMEGTLAAHGLARRRAETPYEYLGRILRDLDVRESAIQQLTGLFEYAKFSPHAVDDGMKDEAIDALVAVRDDLHAEEQVAA
jgi:hypothetical protein